MLSREDIAVLPQALQKALDICKRKFPHLATLDAAGLAQKRNSLFQGLCWPIVTEFHIPKRPQGSHAQAPDGETKVPPLSAYLP